MSTTRGSPRKNKAGSATTAARILGQRGGNARASAISGKEASRIAAMGARAKTRGK